MRSIIFSGLLIVCIHAQSQPGPAITESEVSRIEKTLAADNMQGRQVLTPGIEKAAAFIVKEFKAAGLKPLPGTHDFAQSFVMVDPESSETIADFDGTPIDKKNIVAFTADSSLTITPDSHYKKIVVKNQEDFSKIFFTYFESDQNVLILVDTSLDRRFTRLATFHMPQFEGSGNRIFILTGTDPHQYNIRIRQKIQKKALTNLVGIIPGKSKPGEYVIFSAHYDHLGIGKPDAAGDSIYNGANDDASGTTAVITLAKYFSKIHNNERTIIFAAFTAEEIGEFGSAYFSRKLDPDKVIAMLNIEMIGTESKWGKNSAYITGFDKTDMATILQKNLINSPFSFYPDPYPAQMLFLRSDNATLAKKGVPAHTISTSKMDSEKYYHTQGDGVETLDLGNMTEIIRAIGMSAGSIISGKDTPTRVKQE
jgi:Zn-dependent M28 family amino/carboxypeptidase